jgi:hypothetical protein
MSEPSELLKQRMRHNAVLSPEYGKKAKEAFDKQAIETLIPKDLQPRLKRWAKANDCSLKEAVARLVEHGLDRRK